MIYTNVPPAVAPHGALKSLFGTNPICFGTPTGSKISFILDTSISMINRGKIRVAARNNQKIPEGVALDKFGKPSGEQSRFIKAAYEELGISKDITIIETAESTHIIKIDEMNLLNSYNIIGDRTQVKNMTIDNSYHCMMFYVQTDVGFGKLSGNFKDDRENGVQHLYIGADRGILKEANFSKNEQPFLREARTQLNGLNPLAQLAATYDVNLKLVGNTIFWPGQYVYISPIGFGTGLGEPQTRGSISNQLGLGGYHLITNVQCYIESGKFETSVKALFETSGDGRSNIDREIDKNKTCKDN